MPLTARLGLRSLLLGLVLAPLALRAQADLSKVQGLIRARRFAEAQALIDQALRANPRQDEALALQGEWHLAKQDPLKAVEFADKALQINPGRARLHVLRGSALGMRAQQVNMLRAMTLVSDIRGAFEKAVQLEPTYRPGRIALFSFFVAAPGIAGGGLDKAQSLAEQTLGVDPALGHYFRGLIFQRQKNPGGAAQEFGLCQTADPRFALVYNALGYQELQAQHADQALTHFRRQAELAPEDPNSFDSLGDGWMAKGRTDEAIKAYRQALALSPLFFAAQDHLGKALEQSGQRDEAIRHYRACLQLGTQEGIPQAVKAAKARLKALGVEA